MFKQQEQQQQQQQQAKAVQQQKQQRAQAKAVQQAQAVQQQQQQRTQAKAVQQQAKAVQQQRAAQQQRAQAQRAQQQAQAKAVQQAQAAQQQAQAKTVQQAQAAQQQRAKAVQPPKETVALPGGNGITKYWIHMPTNYFEYLLFLNIYCYFDKVSRDENRIIIYDKNNSVTNIFTHYKLINYEPIQKNIISTDLAYIKQRFTLIHIFDLFLKIASDTTINQQLLKINVNHVFSKHFATAQAMVKNYLRTKLNDKSVILLHLSPTSMTNDVFFILAIRAILKLECIKEKNEIDLNDPEVKKQMNNISSLADDCIVLVYSDCKPNNQLYVKQFIHKICISLPFLKPIIHDGNKCIEELILYNKNKIEIPRNVLYNLSYYVIVDTDENLMFSVATMMNNNATFIFANKFIRPSLAEIMRLKIGFIEHNRCSNLEEIEDNRFVAI